MPSSWSRVLGRKTDQSSKRHAASSSRSRQQLEPSSSKGPDRITETSGPDQDTVEGEVSAEKESELSQLREEHHSILQINQALTRDNQGWHA